MKFLSQLCLMVIIAVGIQGQTLPLGQTSLFVGSGNCAACHVQGSPNPAALLDSYGKDVSQTSYWRSTMMANAAKDPFWQAKVQAEINAHPYLQTIIEDKCTTCHAPMGNTQAAQEGQDDYTISEMLLDPLALDGVSCAVCHQIKDQNLGEGSSFSGHFIIENDRLIYGPFPNPVAGPMQSMVNYTPTSSPHVESSELCAACHTLFTPYVNDAGEVMGEAPEQVPYLEWLNSDYPAQGMECQTCHMPAIEENIILANRPQWLGSRNPLHTHEFVGGNIFMLKLMRDFGSELGVTASSAHFDSSISRTMWLLQNQTADLDLATEWSSAGDTLEVSVRVQNLSGHKFPTAYPSRRAWMELQVENSSGEVVFHSGAWDVFGEISGLDSIYEPHHQLISNEDQVQIYQNIPMDMNGDKTYTLLRIAGYLKDNRIPPSGYRSNGIAADSTRIEGLAGSDPNFNRNGSEEGSGSDIVDYRIGGLSPNSSYRVTATLNYQTIAPRFAQDLFEHEVPEVATFEAYYNLSDLNPTILAENSMVIQSTEISRGHVSLPIQHLLVSAYPNPFNPGVTIQVDLQEAGLLTLRIYNMRGMLVEELSKTQLTAGEHQFYWNASHRTKIASGVYLVKGELLSAGGITLDLGYKRLVYLN